MLELKTPTPEKLKYLLEVAKKYKEDVKSELNECFDLADVYFKIEDSGERKSNKSRSIDFSITDSRKFLSNFTMANVFNRNNAWAKVQISKEVYKRMNDVQGDVADDYINELNKVLERNSDTTFTYMKGSNYYTEISKAIKQAQFGTGIFKINKIKSKNKPFSFENMGYDNIFFTEDALGKPVIVFKQHFPMNAEELIDSFAGYKEKISLPPGVSDAEFKNKVSVVEVMVGMFDEESGLYRYYNAVYDKTMTNRLCEEWTNYPKFIVFRWEVESGGVWGNGPARDNKDLFSELKSNKEKRDRHRDKIVDPPGNFYGNIELMYKVRLEPGSINYGGSGMPGDTVGYQPYNLGNNLVPVDQDIVEQREAVRTAFLAQPLGTVNDSVKSATEQSLRIELFNKQWSTTGELINSEVLYPTFLACYMILMEQEVLEDLSQEVGEGEKKEKYLEFSELVYMNELTRSSGTEEVQQVINYYNAVGSVLPEEQRSVLLKTEEFSEYAAEKMRIPRNIIPSKAEIQKQLMQREQERAALIQAQVQAGGVPLE
ncbi:MAG: portal protein [Paraclostridium sp.]